MKPRPAHPNWPKVLTDWCVIKALGTAGWPGPLDADNGAKAAFVSEVSDYLRFRGLYLRELEAQNLILLALEAVYMRVGGTLYRTAKETFEAAQTEYLIALARSRHDSPADVPCPATPERLRVRLRECELELDACRHPAASAARTAGRQAAVTYWNAVAACRMPEGFFANVPVDGAMAATRARFDLWWALFVRSLRDVLRKTNPSYARLLQALPQLRVEAARPGQKLVLTALVQEWRETNGEQVGLLRDVHFPVLEQRSFVKFHEVEGWFDHHARGYSDNAAVREAATRALRLGLGRMGFQQTESCWNN